MALSDSTSQLALRSQKVIKSAMNPTSPPTAALLHCFGEGSQTDFKPLPIAMGRGLGWGYAFSIGQDFKWLAVNARCFMKIAAPVYQL